jgi:hypothetical protein
MRTDCTSTDLLELLEHLAQQPLARLRGHLRAAAAPGRHAQTCVINEASERANVSTGAED